jgi:hypothetical protein
MPDPAAERCGAHRALPEERFQLDAQGNTPRARKGVAGMYIGIGTLALIVLIVLLVLLVF